MWVGCKLHNVVQLNMHSFKNVENVRFLVIDFSMTPQARVCLHALLVNSVRCVGNSKRSNDTK